MFIYKVFCKNVIKSLYIVLKICIISTMERKNGKRQNAQNSGDKTV